MKSAPELSEKCSLLSRESFVYQSSEQYIIICLRICNLITKNKCDITQLIDFNTNTITQNLSTPLSSAQQQIQTDQQNVTDLSFYMLPQLLSHLNETECKKYASRESYKLSLFICGCLLCLLILCLNLTTLITIIRSKRLRTISNILIANLSIADFLAGLAFLYPCALNLLTIKSLETYDSQLYALACNIRQYYYLCLVGYSPMITSMLSSIQILTLLAGEKYMSILHPYTYERLIQDRKCFCYICLILVWTISIFFSLLPMLGWNEHKYSAYRGFTCNHAQSKPCMFERIFTLDYILCFTSICGLCALVMLFMYIRIYLIARGHLIQINQMNAHVKKSLSYHNSLNAQYIIGNNIEVDRMEMDEGLRSSVSCRNNESVTQSTLDLANSVAKRREKGTEKGEERLIVACLVMLVERMRYRLERMKFMRNSYSVEDIKLRLNKANDTVILQRFASTSKGEMPNVNVRNVLRTSSSSDSIIGELCLINLPASIIGAFPTSNGHDSHVITTSRVSINIRSSLKAIKTLLILCLGFYICWLPLIVYFLTFASKQYDNMTIYILMFVACCNAVIDPLVYAFNNREFCRALLFR